MPPKFNEAQILRTVDNNELGHSLASFAAEFAVLGYFEIALALISLANKHISLYYRKYPMIKPLWLIWEMTGVWPAGEEALVLEDADSGDQAGGTETQKAVTRLAEEYEVNNWENAGFNEKEEQVYDETRLRACVEKLKEITESEMGWAADSTTGWMAMRKGSILLKALEIAVVFQEQGSPHAGNGLPEVDEIMGWIAKRIHANQMITYLTQSERHGGVVKTFTIRYEKGVQRSELWKKSVEDLVKITSDNTINNMAAKADWDQLYGLVEVEGKEGGERKHPIYILNNSLPSSDFATLEKRLDISLPVDYKDFLTITNGMGASWGGIMADPPLHPASEVRWITKEEDYFTDLDAELLPDIRILMDDVYDRGGWPKVGMPLEIGVWDVYHVWLLPPVKVKELVSMYVKQREKNLETKVAIEKAMTSWAGSVEEFENLEWCVIIWAAGGAAHMEAYPSFKAYLVNKAQNSAEDWTSSHLYLPTTVWRAYLSLLRTSEFSFSLKLSFDLMESFKAEGITFLSFHEEVTSIVATARMITPTSLARVPPVDEHSLIQFNSLVVETFDFSSSPMIDLAPSYLVLLRLSAKRCI
ncbi:hypothetical protein N431DRAFT_496761 [Stipitochalara longipes BDJ]|nr:hypothetical protein N431DRAFT_496761 [Stipitochalara longipes BDJ]